MKSTSSEFSDSECSRPKRQCFEERLKSALQRGDTPDDEDEENFDANKVLEDHPPCPSIPQQVRKFKKVQAKKLVK